MEELSAPESSCGCYSCLRIFPFKAIAEFWDEGATPVCPYCGTDSVVIETGAMQVTPERLMLLRRED